jgi:23S rRNA pseudouridine2457 synthase
MLCQFTQEAEGQVTLADLDFQFDKDIYPVGRLDSDSEGLLVLTNDKRVNQRLLNPDKKHPRTYLAQVEGIADERAIERLSNGVTISINGKKHDTAPANVSGPIPTPTLPDRNPPIRVRQSVPDCWIQVEVTEGKNRQVRRMCAAVGLPVLRLVRVKIGDLELGNMQPGDVRELASL